MQHHKTSMILLSAAISIYAEFTPNLTPVSGSTFALQPNTAKLGSSTTISGAATTPTLLFDPPTTTLTSFSTSTPTTNSKAQANMAVKQGYPGAGTILTGL
ncbi:hypothetical protein DL95DRAFT_399189, partial [Leptodontidium sp. 2 PMI_412]